MKDNLTFEQRAQLDEQGNPSSPRRWAFRIMYAMFGVLLIGFVGAFLKLQMVKDLAQAIVIAFITGSAFSLVLAQLKSGYVLGEQAKASTKVRVEVESEATALTPGDEVQGP